MFNYNTRQMSGTQRHVVDKKINDEKQRKAEYDKKKLEASNTHDLDIFKEIQDEIEKFMQENPNSEPEVVFGPDLFEKIKDISPKGTYNDGTSTTIFKKPYVIEDDVEHFKVRKYQVR